VARPKAAIDPATIPLSIFLVEVSLLPTGIIQQDKYNII
jgi:hypothetical protein